MVAKSCRATPWSVLLIVGACIAAYAPQAHAGCNLIPGTAKTFNAAQGATNRPFAAPGETLEVRPRPCDPVPTLTAAATDYVVTVIFTPATGLRNAVVLTADGSCAANIDAKLSACAGQLGGGTAICLPAAQSGLAIVDRNGVNTLSFRFPDTDPRCVGGTKNGLPCVSVSDCPGMGTSCAPDNDDRTLSGPATIAVTAPGDALPCQLATATCANQTGLVACVDDYFANDGACGRQVASGVFPHFTALPPPNDYRSDCFDEAPPCLANPMAELRGALDSAGNLLVPVSWQGILVPGSVPIPRILHTSIRAPIGPFSLPDQAFVGSFTPEGGKLPPIFEPVVDPTGSPPNVVTMFGSVDAPYTILRLARRHGSCVGGANDTQRCSTNEDCPGGSCPTTCVGAPSMPCATDLDCGGNGPCGKLFDFSSLAFNGGPLVLPRPFTGQGICQDDGMVCGANCGLTNPCVNFAFEAQTPVTLDSLANQSDQLRALVSSESVTLQDLNGDGTTASGLVVTLRDRETETLQDIGHDGACIIPAPQSSHGRAVCRSSDPPFSFPAVALENDLVAFLESEDGENDCIENDDGDSADGILRVFQLPNIEKSSAVSPPRAVDGALKINGRSLAISNGRVFFRSSEASMAQQKTDTFPFSLEDGTISGDGRFVAFTSTDDMLVLNDTNNNRDVFVLEGHLPARDRAVIRELDDAVSRLGVLAHELRHELGAVVPRQLLGEGRLGRGLRAGDDDSADHAGAASDAGTVAAAPPLASDFFQAMCPITARTR
jgi:hypothetical protein